MAREGPGCRAPDLRGLRSRSSDTGRRRGDDADGCDRARDGATGRSGARARKRATLPAVRTLAATPIFDWRQLRRWGIRQSQLPAGSIVRFKPPSFWQQHVDARWSPPAGSFLLQSGLIIALVLQSRRRRRAEREAQRRRQELAHMTRVATMGELTASLAHEINQPLAAILSNAQAGQRLLAAGGTDWRGDPRDPGRHRRRRPACR